MTYHVEITDAALESIQAAIQYIAVDQHAPRNAQRWLERLWDTINSLEAHPKSHALAPENDYRPFEILKLNIGDYLVLFTVDDPSQTVYVIGFRHGMRQPQPDKLPDGGPQNAI